MSKNGKHKPAEHAAPPVEPSATAAGARAPTAGSGTAAEPASNEVAQLKDRLLRLQADFENLRKRTLREKNELYARANEDILLELLPVLDHLELALQHAEEQRAGQAFVAGLRLVADQMRGVLQKFGVTPIDAVGQPFDPRWHEAVAKQITGDKPAGTVLAQTRAGYRLGQALLRPAQVVVTAAPAPAPAAEPAED